MSSLHTSVLLDEVLFYFQDLPIGRFIDATVGLGGHSEAILKKHPEIQFYKAYDQDEEALNFAKDRLSPWKEKSTFIHANFEMIEGPADAILADLGVSSLQLDKAIKGFSFMNEGPLDMRMDARGELTAEEIVNTWSEYDLAWIFKVYGEEKKAKLAARAIVRTREEKPFKTTTELSQFLYPLLRNPKSKIHPLTLIFQALRIAVNRELNVLEIFLKKALDALNPGGRLAIISFHSLEDRIVKQFFQNQALDKVSTSGISGLFIDKDPALEIVTKKPVVPSDEEIQRNARSRSAKLRVIQKL